MAQLQTPTAKPRAAIYVVADTREKRAALVSELKTIATKRGHDVVGAYRDERRGGPQLRRLLADAAAGKLDVVLVNWAGHLGKRSRVGALRVLRRLDALHVRVESVTEPWFNVHAPELDWIAEGERRLLERSAKAIEAKRERGEATGTPPIGFRRDENGVLVEDETEQDMIARARELHAEAHGACAIARHLTEVGYTSRSGGAVSHTWVRRALSREP